VARRSAVDQRADSQRQMKTLIVTAPDELRARLRGLSMQRRTKEGMSKKEIIRCLKRYVARELYQLITVNDLELAA
jgi:hypothetical protein